MGSQAGFVAQCLLPGPLPGWIIESRASAAGDHSGLLDDVRQFVCEQASASWGVRRVLTGGERDVVAFGEGPRSHRARRPVVAVHAYGAEVVAEPALEILPSVIGESRTSLSTGHWLLQGP